MRYQCAVTLKSGEKLHGVIACDETAESIMVKIAKAMERGSGFIFGDMVVNTSLISHVYVKEVE